MNSRRKGKAGELEFAHWLTDHGHPARRGQQFAGGPESPDIVCDSLPHVHFEVKRTERLSIYAAIEQAMSDAGSVAMPIVVHRANEREWLIIMRAEDGIRLLGDRQDCCGAIPPNHKANCNETTGN